jgi:hypothetical protein
MSVKNYKQSFNLVFTAGPTDVCTVFKTASFVPFRFYSLGGSWDFVVNFHV